MLTAAFSCCLTAMTQATSIASSGPSPAVQLDLQSALPPIMPYPGCTVAPVTPLSTHSVPTALANDFRSELTQRIGRNEPCWFPGLAPLLVNHFWNQPQSLARQNYGTAPWLGQQAPDRGTV